MNKYSGGIPAGYEDEINDDETFETMEKSTQNLKITVVPNITKSAGINGEDFDAKLSIDMDTWFCGYQELWSMYKSTPTLSHHLKEVFTKDENPMLLALKLFANCPGCNNLKNKNLALFVLETICAFHKSNPEIADKCDDNMRFVVFHFIKTCGIQAIYQGVTTAYQLIKIKDILMIKIEELIDEKRYKDAAYWAIYLEATESFNIYQIILPLILQNKPNVAEEYMDQSKDQQIATMKFLDSLLDKRKTVIDHCYPIIDKYGYTDINHSIISFRPMSKLIARLSKKYQIDEKITPNLSYSKTRSYMYYLYKRFKDGQMSRDSFRELIRDAAVTTVLKYDLVANISSHGDREEALYWVKLYKIPTEKWPPTLFVDDPSKQSSNNDMVDGWADSCSSSSGGPLNKKFNNSGDAYPSGIKNDFLQLELRDEAIILIDCKSNFIDMIKSLSEESLIGFDSEWKPSACQVETVSLLQLATFNKVYLVDVMSENITDDMWKMLGCDIFNNLEILKVGFAHRQDLTMLQKSLPQMNLCLSSQLCYLDLRDLWGKIQYITYFNFPYMLRAGQSGGMSLSNLAQVCLGKALDKSNQLSNWAKRPLRRDQIIYAALDAYCLLQIYKVIAECLTRVGRDIDHIVDQITSKNSTKLENPTNSLSFRSSRRIRRGAICCTKIKLICDSVFKGLIYNLRRLGMDCLEMTSRTNLDVCVQRSREESRRILTRGSNSSYFRRHLVSKMIYDVYYDSVDDQVVEVLQNLGISINKNKIFTRCPKCNGYEFITANNQQIRSLKFGPDSKMPCVTDLKWSAARAKRIWLIFESRPITDEALQTGRTFKSALIKTNKISKHAISSQKVFFICDTCGRVTWPDEYQMSSDIADYILSQ